MPSPLGPLEDGEASFGLRLEAGAIDQLALERCEEALGLQVGRATAPACVARQLERLTSERPELAILPGFGHSADRRGHAASVSGGSPQHRGPSCVETSPLRGARLARRADAEHRHSREVTIKAAKLKVE